MQPVQSCLHCQFLSHVSKALFFNQNSPKMKLFLQKNAIFSSAVLRPQAPVPPAAGGFAPKPPDPHWPPAAGGSAPRPPKQPPIANFWLRAWLQLIICHKKSSISFAARLSKWPSTILHACEVPMKQAYNIISAFPLIISILVLAGYGLL